MADVRPSDVSAPQPVEVRQPPEGTSGRYWAWPMSFTATAGVDTVYQVSWPIDVGMQAVYFTPPAGSTGDEIRRAAVLLGTVGQVVSVVDATRFVLGSPVLGTIVRGMFVAFPTRAPGVEYFLADVDYATGTLTVSDGGLIGAPAALPTGLAAGDPVHLVVRMVPLPIRVEDGARYDFGVSSLRAAFVPAGAVFQVVYRNNGASDKIVSGYAELYY